jgi:tRNA(Arg) A34 adenosine deaminase TadA
MQRPGFELRLPEWTEQYDTFAPPDGSDAAWMRFVVRLARENVEQGTGGPFAATVVDLATGRLVAIGVNLVTSLGLSLMHAEVTAILQAQRRIGSYTLAADGGRYQLISSCEPCAMCIGAVLWSGVRRLVCGATKFDAESIGFDEGPVDETSWQYLAERDIEVVRGVERSAARDVLALYAGRAGRIYNG